MTKAFAAIPYCGSAPPPDDLVYRWNMDPILLAGLGVALILLMRTRFRKPHLVGGALLLSAALYVSPFCALGSALFSVRTAHHLVLVLILGPLVARMWKGSPMPGSLAIWTGLQTVVLWFWHWPLTYEAALSSHALFWAMQLSITLASAGFWHALWSARNGSALMALLATTMQMGLLGALITLAVTPLYSPHYLTTFAWGLTPLEDQQMAGLIMWIPANIVYLALAMTFARKLLQQSLQPVVQEAVGGSV